MEMLPPAPVPPNVVVGATVVKRFPGYGERRGTIAEIDLDGGKVVVRWPSDERTTLSLGEAAKRALYAVPPRRSGAPASKAGARRTRSSTGSSCPASSSAAAATKPPPRRRRAPAWTKDS